MTLITMLGGVAPCWSSAAPSAVSKKAVPLCRKSGRAQADFFV